MKLNNYLINLFTIFNEVSNETNEGFDYLTTPRIIAYVSLALAIIFLLIILIRYLIIRKKSNKEDNSNKN